MRNLTWVCAFISLLLCNQALHAQKKELGIFNSVAVGVNAGTVGFGVDVSTPVTPYVMLRGGISFIPGFKINTDVDIDLTDPTGTIDSHPTTLEMEGKMNRTQGELIASVYPFPKFPFFVAAGAYFGGNKLMSITGHSEELKQLIAQGYEAGVNVGDYILPVDKNGNVSGGLKVNAVRPYVGIGFGRLVPKGRIGFSGELGIQVHGTPQVYTNFGHLDEILGDEDFDDDFSEIIEKLSVYPVLKLRLTGRIF